MLSIYEVPEFCQTREEIYRLRYDVYIVERGFCQKHVDREARIIEEPLDETGHVYAAVVDGEVVGTIRANYAGESDLDDYFEQYGVHPADFENAAVTSKLVVAPRYRATTVAFRLAAAFENATQAGIKYSFIDCDEALVSFYQRLGFKIHGEVEYRYPECGKGVVMLLDVDDVDHLRRVRSPFLKYYRTVSRAGAVVGS